MLLLNIWNELSSLRAYGKTIIVTTHVMDEAEKCDKLALIRAKVQATVLAENSVIKNHILEKEPFSRLKSSYLHQLKETR